MKRVMVVLVAAVFAFVVTTGVSAKSCDKAAKGCPIKAAACDKAKDPNSCKKACEKASCCKAKGEKAQCGKAKPGCNKDKTKVCGKSDPNSK